MTNAPGFCITRRVRKNPHQSDHAEGTRMAKMTRRGLLATGSGVLAGGATLFAVGGARAAEFSYKFATNLAGDHPLNLRAKEAADRIRQESGGRLDIQLFPEQPARLATPTRLSQLRSGAVELFTLVGAHPVDARAGRLDQRHRLRLPGLSHRCGRRWTANSALTSAPPIAKSGLDAHGAHLGQRLSPYQLLDEADRHARRSRRLQDPRSGEPALDLDVQGLRRVARSASTSTRCIRRLQTKIAEGQENPLPLIWTMRKSTRCRNSLAHRAYVGRLLDARQFQGLAGAA